MKIAFYAPLKGPDHPVPSGDREMARLLMRALRSAGHSVDLVSTLRSFAADAAPDRLAGIEAEAEAEASRIEALWGRRGAVPDLWFCYHPFYKAPDLLGPRVAARFGLPYATAEASHAPKRAAGPWARWHAATEAGLRTASLHFCCTGRDREGLEPLAGPGCRLVALPPFIDASPFAGPRPEGRAAGPVRLVCVAMMRPGDKARSFAFLADALAAVPDALDWHLTIIGDGSARADVTAGFARVPAHRVTFEGQRSGPDVAAALARADLYVWPGFNEAYGVGYLEAGAAGLPSLAMRCGGIASVVRDGATGMLVAEGDREAFTAALSRLIARPDMRQRLGREARRFVTQDRTLEGAAAILSAGLRSAMAGHHRRVA